MQKGRENVIFCPWWPWVLTLTFKLVQARDQTRLPSEFGQIRSAVPEISHISYTNKRTTDWRRKDCTIMFVSVTGLRFNPVSLKRLNLYRILLWFLPFPLVPAYRCTWLRWRNEDAVIMVALCNRADHYIFILWLLLSSFLWLPYVTMADHYIFAL